VTWQREPVALIVRLMTRPPPSQTPRAPRRYNRGEGDGYAIAIVSYGVAAVLLALAIRIITG
jgi:hypothetical protein